MMPQKRKYSLLINRTLKSVVVLCLVLLAPPLLQAQNIPIHLDGSSPDKYPQPQKPATPIADFFNWIYHAIPEPPAWVGIIGNASEAGTTGLTDAATMLKNHKGVVGIGAASKNIKVYTALGEKISKAGSRTNLLIDTVGNVASISGAVLSGDKIGGRQETANALLSGACASAGGTAGGKIFFVVGGVLGGPPGAMIGGTLGTAGGALGGSYFYEKVWKPQVTQDADKEFNDSLNTIKENNEQDPILIDARLSALVRDAQALLKTYKLDAANDKAQKVLQYLENKKYLLVNAGKSDKVAQFNVQSQEIIKTVTMAKEAIVKAEAALDNAKTLDSPVLIKELFKSTLEETQKGLEFAGRQDLIDALSSAPADATLLPVSDNAEVPDIITVEGRYVADDHKGWAEDCHAQFTINFVQKTVSGFVSGYITQGPKSHPFAVGGPIKEMIYEGSKEKGNFKGSVEVYYHGAKLDGFPPVDGSMIYPVSGSLEGNRVKASISECGNYEMKISHQ